MAKGQKRNKCGQSSMPVRNRSLNEAIGIRERRGGKLTAGLGERGGTETNDTIIRVM